MPRTRKGTTTIRKRRKLLRQVKGFKWNRKSKIRHARQAILKAGVYAYRDRKTRKRVIRALWQIKINAASRINGTTYSRLTDILNKKGIKLDRKILADLAENEPKVFRSVLEIAGVNVSEKTASVDNEVSPE